MSADRAVVALGNPYRRDDGVGPALLARLRDRDLPSVDCLDLGDAGFDLVHVVMDYEGVVIVDAVDFGGDAGEIDVFDPADATEMVDRRGTHATDLFELFELGDGLAETETAIRVVGIQPAETGFGEGLSPAIAERAPAALDALERALQCV
ncbi:hydrogenase maturation protease [Halorhabdus rudnickae]|uniref:hydrogenase maturation protease n=1 Tax=Halorhabdus rudnickae TaxID=1775544 RepID=UPI001082B2F7|nr:hydrogenase maturation protease [Halorhabdus rudnickae]